MRRDVYLGYLKLNGKLHVKTLLEANNYAANLCDLGRYAEAKSLLRKTIPVALRVLGDSHDLTLGMRRHYAMVLYRNHGATLDDLREAVTTLEDTQRIARRVLGGAPPLVVNMSERCKSREPRSNSARRRRGGNKTKEISTPHP